EEYRMSISSVPSLGVVSGTSMSAKIRPNSIIGADYDLQTCGPGDLDPHAVASVFKAFLRELPEPILTRNKLHLFDAAFEKAKDGGFMFASTPGGSLHRTASSQGTLLSSPSYPSNISSSNLTGNGEGSIPSSSTGELSDSAITPQQALGSLIEDFCAL
ncbi:11036_t:CDS:2, partial [Acaulospora colombiana]